MNISGGVTLSSTPPLGWHRPRFWGSLRKKAEFCVSHPPLPRNPQVEVSGAWLPHSLRVRRQASRPGHPS